jgi:3-hydroxyisobutyrate dehydrogenase
MTCLRNDQTVKTVMKDIFKYAKLGSIIVDNSTTNYELAQNLNQQAKKLGIEFLDAPVTGAEKGAERGDLATSVGGNATAFTRVKDIIKTFSNTVTHMGPAGHGQLTKITNLMISFNVKQGLIEGIRFANAFGINRKKLLNVLLNGSSNSYQATKHADNILKNKLEQKIITPLTRKDAKIAIKNIKKKKLRLHCTELFAKIINK